MGIDEDTVCLWIAYPNEARPEEVAQAYAHLLSEEERARWQAFRFGRQRHEYLTTRALVRTALCHYLPVTPEALRFQLNAHGKPRIQPACGLDFNLSNSSGLVVCLIAREAAVGVDVEPFAHAEKIVDIGPHVFSAPELAQLEELRGAERLDRALSLWTLKEAYIKAKGLGLSLPLARFSFVFGGVEGIRLEVDPSLDEGPGRSWQFSLLDINGHRVALMVGRAAAPRLQQWEARPVLAEPTRLTADAVPWFPTVTE